MLVDLASGTEGLGRGSKPGWGSQGVCVWGVVISLQLVLLIGSLMNKVLTQRRQ